MAEVCDGRRLSFGDIGRGLVQVFDLLHHAEHVPVLPHLNKLLIRDAGNGDTGNTDLSACGRDTQAGAVVCGRAGPAHADPVAFSEVVFDLNMSASEGSIDAIVELIEGPGARCGCAAVVHEDVRCEELANRLPLSLVPDLIEPTSAEVAVCFVHGRTSERQSYADK